MSGNWSTFNRWYENRPRTTKAIMTIVAITGLAIATRVNHMAGLPAQRGWLAAGGAGDSCGSATRTVAPSRTAPR